MKGKVRFIHKENAKVFDKPCMKKKQKNIQYKYIIKYN